MSRYLLASAQRDTITEKRKLSTVIIPTPIIRTSDLYIQTTGIERLDKLALKFYEDATLWWVIAAANGLGKGTLIVPANTTIRIPENSGIDDFIQQINTQR